VNTGGVLTEVNTDGTKVNTDGVLTEVNTDGILTEVNTDGVIARSDRSSGIVGVEEDSLAELGPHTNAVAWAHQYAVDVTHLQRIGAMLRAAVSWCSLRNMAGRLPRNAGRRKAKLDARRSLEHQCEGGHG
jgi:hypothetical protein